MSSYRIFKGDIARLGRASRAHEEAEALGSPDTVEGLRRLYWFYHDEAVALQSTDSVPIASFCEERIVEIQKLQDGIRAKLEKRGELLDG